MTSIARKKHVEDWQAGGLSIAAFCRSRNLKYHTFRLWIKKYTESDPASEASGEASGQTTSMVRLNLPMVVGPPPADTSRSIEIHVGAFRATLQVNGIFGLNHYIIGGCASLFIFLFGFRIEDID